MIQQIFEIGIAIATDKFPKTSANSFMPKPKNAVSKQNLKVGNTTELKELVAATVKLWRAYHLTYDQADYVVKEVRRALKIKRVGSRKTSSFVSPATRNKFKDFSDLLKLKRRRFTPNLRLK